MNKRGKFEIDFKTTFPDGVIFYTASDTHPDFIALFLKDGKASKNKMSGYLKLSQLKSS